jgi:putative acetyltransferase
MPTTKHGQNEDYWCPKPSNYVDKPIKLRIFCLYPQTPDTFVAHPWIGRQPFMEIKIDNLTGAEIADLLREHLANMAANSPPESVHALSLDELRQPEITFWSAWNGAELLGCGALKELDPAHGEIKSMRTASAHRRKGVAARLLTHILEEAKKRNYKRVSLETGSMEAFVPAHRLYASFGFTECGPFADYIEDPNSIFMTKEL